MQKEKIEVAVYLDRKRTALVREKNRIDFLLDDSSGSFLKVRILGVELQFPKARLRNELMARKDDLDAQLLALESEFNAL